MTQKQYNEMLPTLYTGCGVACYSNDFLGKVEKIVEHSQLKRLGLPSNYPIPTHIRVIVVYDSPFVMKGKQYPSGIYTYEQLETGSTLKLFTDSTPATGNFRIIYPASPFDDEQKLAFKNESEHLHLVSKSYGFEDFVLEPLNADLDIDYTKCMGANDQRIICSARFSLAFNRAVIGAYQHPYCDTPLEIVANRLVRLNPSV